MSEGRYHVIKMPERERVPGFTRGQRAALVALVCLYAATMALAFLTFGPAL